MTAVAIAHPDSPLAGRGRPRQRRPQRQPGLRALGGRILRDRHRGRLQLTGGAEYLQKIGVGASAAWRRLLVDAQVAFGLSDLAEEPTGAVGRSGASPQFTTGDRKARSVRVAAGWVF